MVTTAVPEKFITPGFEGAKMNWFGVVGSGVKVPMGLSSFHLTFEMTAPGIGCPVLGLIAVKITGIC